MSTVTQYWTVEWSYANKTNSAVVRAFSKYSAKKQFRRLFKYVDAPITIREATDDEIRSFVIKD